MITFEDVKNNETVRTYIRQADESLTALGFTEHGFSHVTRVAAVSKYILSAFDYPERDIELAQIAGFMHDIGNLINRTDHAQSGALMAFRILDKMGMDPEEICAIVTAIGNHDEGVGVPVDAMSAALILADKCDVRRSRVRNQDKNTFDQHDRVNYSVYDSVLDFSEDKTELILRLTLDDEFASIMDYFEIFMKRMLMCRRAAQKLGLKFRLIMNDQQM